jgi:TatA/E family protein of Tat protein translocase
VLDLVFDHASLRGPADDQALGAAIARAANVVLGAVYERRDQGIYRVVSVLFGANRLPQLARSLGSSMKEFKRASRRGSTRRVTPRPRPPAVCFSFADLWALHGPLGVGVEPLAPLPNARDAGLAAASIVLQ